jgi:hypothetical protein
MALFNGLFVGQKVLKKADPRNSLHQLASRAMLKVPPFK